MENEWSIYYRDSITKFLKYKDLINFLFFYKYFPHKVIMLEARSDT